VGVGSAAAAGPGAFSILGEKLIELYAGGGISYAWLDIASGAVFANISIHRLISSSFTGPSSDSTSCSSPLPRELDVGGDGSVRWVYGECGRVRHFSPPCTE